MPAIADWTDYLIAAGRPKTTRQLRQYQLTRYASDQMVGPWRQTTDDMVQWLAGKDWSSETRRSYRSALRNFYKWAYATARMSHDPGALLPPIKPGSHRPRPTPERLLKEALLRAEPRVRLMITLAGRHGMRRGEIAVVHTDDLVEDLSGWSLLVHGKGDKERVIPLGGDTPAWIRSRPHGWLFPSPRGGHLGAIRVGELVTATLGEAGWTTHSLRHRFATVTYAGCRDTYAVQDLLGHASPETTRRYVQLPQDALRAAMSWAA